MKNRFQGDPKIYLTENGADLKFIGGQPVMDSGIENQAVISLLGGFIWWGNFLIDDTNKKLTSDFEKSLEGGITLQKLNDIKQSAERNLKSDIFGNVEAEVLNTESYRINLNIKISPPGQDIQKLKLSKHGQNWKNQADDPTYVR